MVQTIDPASAKSLIKEYQEQNSSPGGTGLITSGNKFLKGFFIDRETLEHILHHHQDVAGIAFFLAKDPNFSGTPDHHYTLIFSGAKPNTHVGHEPYEAVGDIFVDPPPCPPYCTGGI